MSDATIGEVVARQYDKVWGTLRDAVSKLSDEQWRTGECDWLAPARQAYHLVETADFLSRGTPDGVDEPIDWDGGPVDALPSREQLLAYLDRVQPVVREWLTACDDATMLAPETWCDFLGGTRLDRALYSLRHSQHHVGVINADLRHKCLPRGAWA